MSVPHVRPRLDAEALLKLELLRGEEKLKMIVREGNEGIRANEDYV